MNSLTAFKKGEIPTFSEVYKYKLVSVFFRFSPRAFFITGLKNITFFDQ